MNYKTKFALALAVFLWASAFVAIRAGLHGYSPGGLALLRFIIASLCMAVIYYRLPKRSSVRVPDILCLMGIGAVGIGIYNIALNNGELAVSSGMASFIISQSPIVTAVFALLFLGEKLNIARIIGFIVSVLGVVLISMGQKGGLHWSMNLLYIFIATMAGSFYTVTQKPFLKRYHAIEATAFVIWGGTLFLSLHAPELKHDLIHATLDSTLTVTYLGIFPAAMGYVAWTYALNEIPAARAASALYFIPFVATLLGWVWLGETPMMVSLLGGMLAVVGVFLVNRSYHLTAVK